MTDYSKVNDMYYCKKCKKLYEHGYEICGSELTHTLCPSCCLSDSCDEDDFIWLEGKEILSMLELQAENENNKNALERIHTWAKAYPLDIFPKPYLIKAHEVLKKAERFNNLQDENEKYEDALERIQSWTKAYPLDIFPKPDLKKAAKVLKDNGMTLDSISADAMRHVLDGIKDIVEQALKGE
jgi:hypothetical protein